MTTEQLAAWYFRLNGFFTITNFVLHPSRRGGQRTDADIAGVRFPYRSEFPAGPGADEPEFSRVKDRPYFVIAEVKTTMCALNGPWTDENKQNIQKVLRDLGPIPGAQIEPVAEALYKAGIYDSPPFYCSLFCVGSAVGPDVSNEHPLVPQRTWKDLLEFIFERFHTYRIQKADHQGWDHVGKELWNCSGGTKEEFMDRVIRQTALII